MLRLTHFKPATLSLLLLSGAIAGRATTVNFATSLTLGNLPQSVTVSGITATAFDVLKSNGTVYNNAILNNRNEGSTELGLGVCASSRNCPTTGNGDINEIDNNGLTFDVIRLDFGAITLVNSIGLSSLDSGLKDGYAIFGSNTALPNLSLLAPLAQGTNQSAGSVTPTITLNSSFQYFFVAPKNRGANDSDSDYLLSKVTYTPTPEPLSAGLLGLGLLAMGLVGRKRRAV